MMCRCNKQFTCLLLLVLASPAFSSKLEDYDGQFVLRLGNRNFIVLNLGVAGARRTGTISRPRHSSLGAGFTNISADILTASITSARLVKDHLSFVATDPGNPSDTDAYDLTLRSSSQASLQLSGVPIDPWALDRVPVVPLLRVSKNWNPNRVYHPGESNQSNPEMQRIMDADQAVRQTLKLSSLPWAEIDRQDAERRNQVLALLKNNALHSGKDFEQAAFVLQHGVGPNDYLLAHTLAMIALSRGNGGAVWIATATLDRYLQSVKQPQIYGTQFNTDAAGMWTQDPYDRDLLSDSLRRQLSVPARAAQQKQLDQYKKENRR